MPATVRVRALRATVTAKVLSKVASEACFRPRWSMVCSGGSRKAARRSAARRADGGGVGADGHAAAVEVGEAGGEGVDGQHHLALGVAVVGDRSAATVTGQGPAGVGRVEGVAGGEVEAAGHLLGDEGGAAVGRRGPRGRGGRRGAARCRGRWGGRGSRRARRASRRGGRGRSRSGGRRRPPGGLSSQAVMASALGVVGRR